LIRDVDSQGPVDRRKFLIRNLAAIGSIAMSLPGCIGGDGRGAASGGSGSGGSNSQAPHCFLKGTRIRTADGDDRLVEDLVPGDLLLSVFGGVRAVQWVGRYVSKRSDPAKPWVPGIRPIRVARSAIAPNVPENDLFLSSGHHLYLDGVLAPVGQLANGTTIHAYAAEEFDELEYLHIKVDGHDVIFAEGAPCETLINVTERAANFADYFRRHGENCAEEAPCAPVVRYKGRRGMIASRLRSAASPWLDRRTRMDFVRDRLEDRAVALRETV
jgi:hypothetical protein